MRSPFCLLIILPRLPSDSFTSVSSEVFPFYLLVPSSSLPTDPFTRAGCSSGFLFDLLVPSSSLPANSFTGLASFQDLSMRNRIA